MWLCPEAHSALPVLEMPVIELTCPSQSPKYRFCFAKNYLHYLPSSCSVFKDFFFLQEKSVKTHALCRRKEILTWRVLKLERAVGPVQTEHVVPQAPYVDLNVSCSGVGDHLHATPAMPPACCSYSSCIWALELEKKTEDESVQFFDTT